MSEIVQRRPRRTWRQWFDMDSSNPAVAWLLLLPHAIFFVAFIVYPIIRGAVISLQRWDPLRDEVPFVGLEHYGRLVEPGTVQFGRFWDGTLNTLLFTVIATPLLMALALGLAVLLHGKVKGRGFFRSVFFVPTILSVSVISIIWRWLFADDIGVIGTVLRQWGFDPPDFLTTEGWAWVPVVVSTLWWSVGLNFVLYMAGLSGISESYHEAAQLDGANWWQRFIHVTLPLLAPTTLFVTVTTILQSAQLYGQSQLITGGGPNRSTESVMMYITDEAFTNNQLSSAMAMSFVFGAMMLFVTVVQFRSMARGVKGPTS